MLATVMKKKRLEATGMEKVFKGDKNEEVVGSDKDDGSGWKR